MSDTETSPALKHSSQGVSNSQVYLLVLFLVFIVGFGLQALLNYSISQTIDRLDAQAQNIRYQGYLSDNIMYSMQNIETQFYRMTISESQESRRNSLQKIVQAHEAIAEDLRVLQQGGAFKQRRLVSEQNAQDAVFYYFDAAQATRCPDTEAQLLSGLARLQLDIEEFGHLVNRRDELMQAATPELTEVMIEIRHRVLEFVPLFESLLTKVDGIRQLYAESLYLVEQAVESEKTQYRYWQIGLTLLVMLVGLFSIGVVARQLRRAHQKLEASEAYVSDVLESQSNIVVVTDGRTIIDASGGFFAFFDQYPDLASFLSQHQCICDTFIKEDGLIYKFEDQNWVEYILAHPDQTHKAKILRKGKLHTFYLSATQSVRFKRFIVSLTDITEIQALNQSLEQEKNRALDSAKSKSEFLANMSHEIRTPLNAILGFISVLKEKEIDPERLRYLRTVHDSSQTLLGIINDILDFSKIENNKLDVDIHAFNPRQEFSSVAGLFEARCDEKKLSFDVKLANNLPGKIESDPLRIKQVLSNLLSNAVKFTPSGKSVCLTIDYDFERKRLYCEVRDQGIGIAKENQAKIFEAFSQAENSTTRQFGGTGLGLSISSRLIEILGGKLTLQSELGEGSCFAFNLPAKLIQAAPSRAHKEEKKLELASLQGKILLVEDNPTNQMLMKVVLAKIGLSYDVANDGQEGVAMFEANDYDAILMDENMPNMSGVEATKRIRELEREGGQKAVPIIALTANAIKGDQARFLAAGMDDYLTKPVDFELLGRTLSNYLSAK